MGEAGEAQNPTHQQKKMGEDELRKFRDRFNIPVTDEQLPKIPFIRPEEDSQEMKYLRERGAVMGTLPARQPVAKPLEIPGLEAFDAMLKGTDDRENFHHDGFCAFAQCVGQRQKISASKSCLSYRTNHALSAWKACSANSVSSRSWDSCTHARCRSTDVLQRVGFRSDFTGRH